VFRESGIVFNRQVVTLHVRFGVSSGTTPSGELLVQSVTRREARRPPPASSRATY